MVVSYNDLRIANSKLVEFEYTKQINTKLYNIIHNDSLIINDYITISEDLTKKSKKYKRQRNACFITAISAIVGLVVAIIK